MKKNDIYPAIIWLLLGITVAAISYKLKLGSLEKPGPGLMPFLLGVSLSICSIPIIVRSFLAIKGKEKQEGIWSGVEFKKLILVVVPLLVYIVLLEKIGFVLITFPLLLIFFKIIDSRKWRWAFTASVLTVLISFFLFVVFLKVELPRGLWK